MNTRGRVLDFSSRGHERGAEGGIRNIHSQDYSFPGTFVPMMELSFSGPFVPWNIRSLDRSFPGTFVLKTIRSLEHSFPGLFVPCNFRSLELLFQVPPGPFLPRTVRAFVSRAVPGLEQRNKQKRRPMTATVHTAQPLYTNSRPKV